MQENRKGLIVYGIALLCLAFVIGFLLGKGNGKTEIAITTAPEQPVSVQKPAPEELDSSPVVQGPSEEAPLNINTAQQAELELLPGIGPELAQRIISYRQENGSFIAEEQLMDVEGIGEKRFSELEPLITIGGMP